jgi:uncharacterized membrane protein YedE/YeeE
MNAFRKARWSPYVVGTLIGVLSWATFLIVDKPLGVSTAFVQTVGLLENAVAPTHVAESAYFRKIPPKIGWEWMLVFGILLGAFASSMLSGDRPSQIVPLLWQRRFGSSVKNRFAWAFVGGALAMFGARMAGGCTSGHGISGGLQLAVSSWTFMASVFAAGIPMAFLLYRKERYDV